MNRPQLLLCLAVAGWVSGFWLCKGPREQFAWFLWVFLPVLVWHGRQIPAIWHGWSGESRRWWLLLAALLLWQFLVTGFRAGSWWKGPAAGRDVLVTCCVICGLVLVGRDDKSRVCFWRCVFLLGSVGVVASLLLFYSELAMHEERFRLCWRWWPGFDAVTTGIFTGMALLSGLVFAGGGPRWWRLCTGATLAVLGFGLAASESRGALLAVGAAVVCWLPKHINLWRRFVWPVSGFSAYWLALLISDQESSGLVERGASGRFDIYRVYLSRIDGWEWIVGKGEVGMLSESVLGWLVHHPHSAYLGQLVGFGMIGLVLMVVTLISGYFLMRRSRESAILVFGLVALLFDGGVVFSTCSIARWEVLVAMVPLVLGVAGSRPEDEPCLRS